LEKSKQEEAYTLGKMRLQGYSKSCYLQVLAFVGLVIVLGLVLPGCGGSEPDDSAENTTDTDQPSAATQTSEGGGVTVAVTWQGPSGGPAFEVAMDTHSVDLDIYDLRQLAVLRNDQGQEVQPNGWDAPEGGHHREGTLSFPTETADGGQVIGPDAHKIELVIRDVADVPERRFEWTL
jgi:hypothetical protein